MSLAHFLTWRRLSLLAAAALAGEQRERAMRHVARCERCAQELRSLREVLALIERDPVRSAEPQLSLEALRRRTEARLGRPLAATAAAAGRARLLWAPLATAAVLSAVLLVPPHDEPAHLLTGPDASSFALSAAGVTIDDETLRRLERRVAREQAARYLSDAGAVLVTVAGAPHRCDREHRMLDLQEETRRSQALLRRRALLIDLADADIGGARPVLEDVESVLRAVALLEPCERPEQLLAIHDRLREGRLLMKISLMTRELQG